MTDAGPPSQKRSARPPTMIDVAAAAGVALKTVSRFVNGETNIDPVLAGRIASAIETLGYRRNLQAASIRPGWTSKVIGLIISDLANPYYSSLARAVESVAAAHRYLLTTVSSEEDGDRHDRAVDRLIEQRVDALIVVPPRHPGRSWLELRPPIPPVVFIDRPSDLPTADTVLSDNAGGAKEATAVLAGTGARRIAFVGDSLEIYTMAERHRGYQEGLAEAGLPIDPSLTITTAHSTDDALTSIRDLLEVGTADAIFAANNRAAIGALHAFGQAGTRLPIIAFDDFEAASLVTPPMSVVAQNVATMGSRAAELALQRINEPGAAGTTTVLPTSLILRGSERLDGEPAQSARTPSSSI